MSTSARRRREIETLAWITDDEAEFWTNYSPTATKKEKFKFSHSPKNSVSSEVTNSNDGLYFKSNDQITTENEDRFSLLYNQNLEKQEKEKNDNEENLEKQQQQTTTKPVTVTQETNDVLLKTYEKEIRDEVKEVEREAEKKPISEIFEFDENVQLNENVPGTNMSFLDRLFHQLTRPRASIPEYPSDDDEYSEIDPREITAVTNTNTEEVLTADELAKVKPQQTLAEQFQTFIEEVLEETDVIRGNVDEDTFVRRRSRLAKRLLEHMRSKGEITNRASV